MNKMSLKNERAVTMLELLIAISLIGTIVLAAALAQKLGLDFIETTSNRIAAQNVAHNAMEKIVQEGRKAESFNTSDCTDNRCATITFDNGKSFSFGEGELEGIEGYFKELSSNKRFSIHIRRVEGESDRARDTVLDTQVTLRPTITLSAGEGEGKGKGGRSEGEGKGEIERPEIGPLGVSLNHYRFSFIYFNTEL